MKNLNLILLLAIITCSVNVSARPNGDLYYKCVKKAGSECGDGSANVSCGWENVPSGKNPCDMRDYFDNDENAKLVKGKCCPDGPYTANPPKNHALNIPFIGELVPKYGLNLYLYCNNGDEFDNVYDWSNQIPKSWIYFEFNMSMIGNNIVINATEKDSLGNKYSSIEIIIPVSTFSNLCPSPENNRSTNYLENKITKVNKLDFTVLKDSKNGDLTLDFNNPEVLKDQSLKINIYSIDGKLLKSIYNTTDVRLPSFKYTDLPKGVIIIEAITNNNKFTLKYLFE